MEVREMVAHMVDVAGLDFPDLTGHNVMVDEAGQAAWIIDFEHAQPVGGRAECCDFIQEFLDGRDGWNVDFAWAEERHVVYNMLGYVLMQHTDMCGKVMTAIDTVVQLTISCCSKQMKTSMILMRIDYN
jgi:hypothetical protein